MAKRNVHVVRNGKGWAVKLEGAAKPLSNHKAQQTAAEAGKSYAACSDRNKRKHEKNQPRWTRFIVCTARAAHVEDR